MRDTRPTICVIATSNKAHHMRIYYRICQSLINKGFLVELIALSDDKNEFIEGVNYYSVGNYRVSLGIHLLRRLQRVRLGFSIAADSKADMFCFTSPEFISAAINLRLLTGKPVVFDCMEDFESYAMQRPGIPRWVRPFLRLYTRYQLRRAGENLDAIITSDRGTEEFFRSGTARTLVVHNFPLLNLFSERVQADSQIYDLVIHGSIGRYYLEMIMDIDCVLVERGRLVKWYLFGHMPEKKWFLDQIVKRQAKERFFLKEYIPHDQVAAEVQKARIGVIPLPDWPKYQSNIPQKLFEYMSLRIPVVTSDLPPSRPFVGVGDRRCAVLVKPDDPKGYADAIIELLDTPSLRHRMGEEGRRRVEDLYNWDKEFEKLLTLFGELGVSS